MEPSSRKLEALLGAIVLSVIGAFVWLSLAVGGAVPRNAVRYHLLFDSALGLSEDNPVAVAGVKVGVVEAIGIQGRKAKVTVAISPDVELRTDAIAAVRAKTLLGEKYIDLDPGELPTRLPEGTTLDENTPTVEVDQLIRSAAQLVRSLNVIAPPLESAIARLEGVLQSTDGQAIGDEFLKTLADAGVLIRETSQLVQSSSSDMQEMLKLARTEGPQILEKIGRASARLDEILASVDPTSLKNAADRIEPTTERIEMVVSDLRVAMAEVKRASARVDNILVKVDRALTRTEDFNERTIREFLQVEGVRVNLIPDARVERRVRKLKNEGEPLPVP